MKTVSLDTAVTVSGTSKRTWWRRISDGTVQKLPADAKGRAMVSLDDFIQSLPAPFPASDIDLVLAADAGDASAQNELGQLLHSQGRVESGLRFVTAAADAGCADAMQWLGRVHAGGMGVEANNNLALAWIAKAAAHGHKIAARQMQGLSWS